jgi:hypothetical protein
MDMRLYWVQDRIDQGQFHVFWAPGSENCGDYYTKDHPIHHHRTMRPIITNHPPSALSSPLLRGCVASGITHKVTRNARRPDHQAVGRRQYQDSNMF